MSEAVKYINDAEDLEIIELYWNREQEAISRTEAKYSRYLGGISGKVLMNKEDIEECVSDTYLGAWNAIPPTRPNVLRVFLGKIARNLSLKKLRGMTAEKRGGGVAELTLDELAEVLPDSGVIGEELEAKELAALIDEFLAERNPRDRVLFIRRYWYFDSVKEIADAHSLSESNVKMALKRTRDDLKGFLANKGIYV